MADTQDLGSCAERRGGSSPFIRTNSFEKISQIRNKRMKGTVWTRDARCKKQVGKQTLAIPSQEPCSLQFPSPHQLIWEVSQIRNKRMKGTVWTRDARCKKQAGKQTLAIPSQEPCSLQFPSPHQIKIIFAILVKIIFICSLIFLFFFFHFSFH